MRKENLFAQAEEKTSLKADLEAAAELLTALARRHGVSILASGSAEGTTVSALHSATSPAPGDRGKGESAHV